MSDPDAGADVEIVRAATLMGEEALELADLLNTVLDKGAVVHGEVIIAVADVDLIRLNLGLLLSAVASTDRDRPTTATKSLAGTLGPLGSPVVELRASTLPRTSAEVVSGAQEAARSVADAPPKTSLNAVAQGLPDRINADAEGVESGLARLVLTLIEVLRKVLEHQAVRRMEGGRLTEEEVERLGLALSRLDTRMQDLKRVFGLSDEDLQIDLGPLGRLR